MYAKRVSLVALLLGLSLIAGAVAAQGIAAIDLKPTSADKIQVTVSGAFGSKPNIVYYNDFRGDALFASISNAGQLAGTTGLGRNIPSVGVMDETKGFYIVDAALDEPAFLYAIFDKAYEDVFLAYSVGIPKGYGTPLMTESGGWFKAATWKMVWMLQTNKAYTEEGQFDMCGLNIAYLNSSLWGNHSKFASVDDGVTYTHANVDKWWAWNTLNHMQIILDGDQATPANTAGSFSVVNKTFKYVNFPHNPTVAVYQGPPPSVSQINFPGWFRGDATDKFQALYSNIYIAAGAGFLSRFELTDSKNYEKSTYRRVLFPTSWDSKLVTFNIYPTEFKRTGGLFIHYFNDKGQRIGEGFNACEKCPEMSLTSSASSKAP